MPSRVTNTCSKFYGGDKFDDDNEETVRLFLKDCHQKQSDLYTLPKHDNSSLAITLTQLSKGELLYVSGQSRLHLNIREVNRERMNIGTVSKCSNIQVSEEIDFILFKKVSTNVHVPDFPLSLEEEADAFRSHGFPLLVWPSNLDAAEIQKYLEDYYPDCAHWFAELASTQHWLNEKWLPLSDFLGIPAANCATTVCHSVVNGLPIDAIATSFIRERTTWSTKYVTQLENYLLKRRLAVPGFQNSPLHRQLEDMSFERTEALPNDAGFFNVIGNRLLELGLRAQKDKANIQLDVYKMAESISNPQHRTQFLSVLLPMSEVKEVFYEAKSKRKLTSSLEKSSEIALQKIEENSLNSDANSDASACDEYSNDDELSDSQIEKVGEPKKLPSISFPHRPVTKEIMDNRGIMKYRHKRERNPRVHLRYKYRKALIRYRSRVPPIRIEDKPYAGEIRGIRVNLIKSHTFKRHK